MVEKFNQPQEAKTPTEESVIAYSNITSEFFEELKASIPSEQIAKQEEDIHRMHNLKSDLLTMTENVSRLVGEIKVRI